MLLLKVPVLRVSPRSWPSKRPSRGYAVRPLARASSTSAPPPPPPSFTASASTAPPFGAQSAASRLQELSKLLQETGQLAVATVQAVLSIARESVQGLQGGAPDTPPVVLRKLFERLGATYIKLGQFIASSPTLFPPEYVLEFQKCLDQTTPVPFSVIRRTVESELRMSLEDVFVSVDATPLASASIAQVHAAVLRGSNKEVVIKVLKPGVQDVLTTDLNFLYIATRFLEFAQPQLSRASLSAVVGDIRASMLDEVDFTKEAQHLQEFGDYLDRSGLRPLATCPSAYKQYSTQRVLVMDRLRGVPLTDLSAISSITGVQPELVLINALNVWFGSVVGCPTFHADVHAGNLLVLRDGRVGFIDFGIVGRISPVTWRAVEALLTATVSNDYITMARALATIGVTNEAVDIPAFARDLEELFSSIQQIDSQLIIQAGTGEVTASEAAEDAQASVNRVMLDLVRVGEIHGIRFPREFALLIKQLLYFDRYNRILAPTLQVFNDQRINLRKVDLDYDLN
ncbi:hypothetical protein N2152v2_009541 [Parachlorella kessleri]